MKIYIIQKTYPDLELVDDDLVVYGHDVAEIVEVYRDYYDALIRTAALQDEADQLAYDLECDPVEYTVAEWEVNEGGE